MTLNEFARKLDVNLDTTLPRFGGSEALFIKFLRKGADDTTFSKLSLACSKQDYPQIEMAAHTLKGVSANLGLSTLSEASALLVAAVRQENYGSIPALFSDVAQIYQNYISSVSLLDN